MHPSDDEPRARPDEGLPVRALADVPSIEVISRAAVMLMSAAAEKLGLADDDDPAGAGLLADRGGGSSGTGLAVGGGAAPAGSSGGSSGTARVDLDEARRLITALAGLVTASVEYLGPHAAALRDGLQALQRAFREASPLPDAPGQGPGERWTGRVV